MIQNLYVLPWSLESASCICCLIIEKKLTKPSSFQFLLAGLVGTPRQVERFKMNNVQTFQTWPFTRCKRMWKESLYRKSWSHTEFVKWLHILWYIWIWIWMWIYLSSRIRWPVRHAQRTVPGGSIQTAIGFRRFLLLMSWSFYVLISWVRNFLCSFRSRRFWGKNQFLRSPLDDWSLSTWEIFQLFPDFILIYSTLLPILRPH